jgi:N-dimethylarginine dimethylaminohydrolase
MDKVQTIYIKEKVYHLSLCYSLISNNTFLIVFYFYVP